jgi:hypothetical protein
VAEAWLRSASVAAADVAAIADAHEFGAVFVLYQLPAPGASVLGGPLDFSLVGHWPLAPPDLRAALTESSEESFEGDLPAAEVVASAGEGDGAVATAQTVEVALVALWPPLASSSSGSELEPFTFDMARSTGCFRASQQGRALTCSRAPPLPAAAADLTAPPPSEAAAADAGRSRAAMHRHNQARVMFLPFNGGRCCCCWWWRWWWWCLLVFAVGVPHDILSLFHSPFGYLHYAVRFFLNIFL